MSMREIRLNPSSTALLFLSYCRSYGPEEDIPVLKIGAGSGNDIAPFMLLLNFEVLEKYRSNKALAVIRNLDTRERKVSIRIGDITKSDLQEGRYAGVYCADLISNLPRDQGEEVVRKIVASLTEGGVFYIDFSGSRTWDLRTNKENYEVIGENSYRPKALEPCEYGGYHEYLTLHTEEQIRELLGDCDIFAFLRQECETDLSDRGKGEAIGVFGQKK